MVELDYTMIKEIRRIRSKTQAEFAELMGVGQPALSRLETGEFDLTPLYMERLRKAIRRLRISNDELRMIKRLQTMRHIRGYKK